MFTGAQEMRNKVDGGDVLFWSEEMWLPKDARLLTDALAREACEQACLLQSRTLVVATESLLQLDL